MIRILTLTLAIAAASAAVAQDAPTAEDILPEGMTLSEGPVIYSSPTGEFQVLFPSGCGQLNVRTNEPDLWGGETFDDIVQVQYVYCDRNQEQGTGCSIAGIYNWHDPDGEPAGPQQVVRRIRDTLARFKAEVVSQKGVQRRYDEYNVVEGMDVWAKATQGPGEIRIMGLLREGDVYVLAAWNAEGSLEDDAQMMEFFDSFQPFVDEE